MAVASGVVEQLEAQGMGAVSGVHGQEWGGLPVYLYRRRVSVCPSGGVRGHYSRLDELLQRSCRMCSAPVCAGLHTVSASLSVPHCQCLTYYHCIEHYLALAMA